MKTFIYIFILFSFLSLVFQTFFVTKIVNDEYFKIHSKLFNYFSYTYLLYKPFRFKFYHRYFDISYFNTPFFFSNHNLSWFIFHLDSKFSFQNFLFNRYNFPIPISSFRSNFINYSLTHVNICTYYKFQENDFKDLTFSKDLSFIFGSFSVVHSSYISDNPFTYVYKYNFVFSLVDFSITLYINFMEFDSNNIIIPVAFFKLSIKDYRYLISLFSSSTFEKIDYTVAHINSSFSKFFCVIFSTFLIPSRDNVSFGSKKHPYLFIKNIIYSNIDSRYFKKQDTPLEYYTLFSSPKTKTDFANVSTIRAFSFFRIKLSIT